MSMDEVARVLFYASILPAFVMVGVLAWNGQLRASDWKMVAVLLWIAASVFGLQMLGLVLLRMNVPRQGLLYMNTALIGLLAILPWVVVLRRVSAAPVVTKALAGIVALLLGLGLR